MQITLGSATDLGRRESNQDSVLAVLAQNLLPRRQGVAVAAAAPSARRAGNLSAAYVQSSALLILADGMGGRAGGQLASETATKTVYRELAHTLAMQEGVDAAYLEKSLDGAVRQANGRIHALAAKNLEAEGMGTTCTAALVMRDLICVAHVGDSRAYLMHGLEDDNGEAEGGSKFDDEDEDDEDTVGAIRFARAPAELLTKDHSVVASEVRAGRLTEDEARRSRFRNVITRAVGVDADVTPDILTRPVALGMVSHLVLSSDGLHGSVGDEQMEAIVRRHARAPQRAANALVSAAKRAGATDNISVIVARIDATGENHKVGPAIDFEDDDEIGASAADGGGGDGSAQPGGPSHRQTAPSSGKRRLDAGARFWQLACLGLGLVFIAALVGILLRPAPKPASVPPVAKPMAAPQLPPPDPATVAYASKPQSLLSRPVAPNMLLLLPNVPPEQGNLVVVDAKARRVLKLRTSDGLVSTSVPESGDLIQELRNPKSTSIGNLTATDSAGDVYRIDLATDSGPSLAKYDASGRLIQAIAPGAFTRPSALAVTPYGDIFVIDGGTLKWLPAIKAQ